MSILFREDDRALEEGLGTRGFLQWGQGMRMNQGLGFNPSLHPRDRVGKFASALEKLVTGSHVELPHGVKVHKVHPGSGRGFQVRVEGKPVSGDRLTVKQASDVALRHHDERKKNKGVREGEIAEAEANRKLKCPKCDTVQSASNEKCVKCGRDLSEARKAKFAQEASGTDVLFAQEGLYDEAVHPRGRGGKWVAKAAGDLDIGHVFEHRGVRLRVVRGAHKVEGQGVLGPMRIEAENVDTGERQKVATNATVKHFVRSPGLERAQQVAQDRHRRLHNEQVAKDEAKFAPGDRVQHRDGSQAVVTGAEVDGRTPVKFKDGSRDPEHVFHVKSEDLESLERPKPKKAGSKMSRREGHRLLAEGLLGEATVAWDPALHPRRRGGKFAMVLGKAVRVEKGGFPDRSTPHRAFIHERLPDIAGSAAAISHYNSAPLDVRLDYQRARSEALAASDTVAFEDKAKEALAKLDAVVRHGVERKQEDTRAHTEATPRRELRTPRRGGQALGRVAKAPAGRVTLSLGMVPDEFAVQHGYADARTVASAADESGRRMVGIHWKPGIDPERVIFHYLYGHPAPPNFEPGSRGHAQFSYTGKGGKKADREALLRKITQALDAREAGDLVEYERLLEVACTLRAVCDPPEWSDLMEASLLDLSEFYNVAERAGAAVWDPLKHPRVRGGRFAEVLAHVRMNGYHNLGYGVVVEKKMLGFKVSHPGHNASHHLSDEEAVRHGLQLMDNAARKVTGKFFMARYSPGDRPLANHSMEQLRAMDHTNQVRQEIAQRALGRHRAAHDAVTGVGSSKAQALVDSGLADDLADARAQLADMGEGGKASPGEPSAWDHVERRARRHYGEIPPGEVVTGGSTVAARNREGGLTVLAQTRRIDLTGSDARELPKPGESVRVANPLMPGLSNIHATVIGYEGDQARLRASDGSEFQRHVGHLRDENGKPFDSVRRRR